MLPKLFSADWHCPICLFTRHQQRFGSVHRRGGRQLTRAKREPEPASKSAHAARDGGPGRETGEENGLGVGLAFELGLDLAQEDALAHAAPAQEHDAALWSKVSQMSSPSARGTWILGMWPCQL